MQVSFDFTNKVVVITGGATGIGRATAVEFAKAGANVVVGDIDDRANETMQIITDAGGTATFVTTDVTNDDSVKNLIDTAVNQHGTIDIAFNNAGILPPTAPLHEQTVEDWHRTLNVDATGVFLAMRHEIPVMLKAGGGSIVNTASVAGVTADPEMTPLCCREAPSRWALERRSSRLCNEEHSRQHSRPWVDPHTHDRTLAERPRNRATSTCRFTHRARSRT